MQRALPFKHQGHVVRQAATLQNDFSRVHAHELEELGQYLRSSGEVRSFVREVSTRLCVTPCGALQAPCKRTAKDGGGLAQALKASHQSGASQRACPVPLPLPEGPRGRGPRWGGARARSPHPDFPVRNAIRHQATNAQRPLQLQRQLAVLHAPSGEGLVVVHLGQCVRRWG